jgi:hypothetical protein
MSDSLERLLGVGVEDPGCEATFEVLDRYVEAVLRGEDVKERFAGVIAHLRNCDACREDAEGLLAALREIESLPET